MAYNFSRLSYHQILPETGLNSTHFFLIQKRRRSVSSHRSLHPWDHGPHHPHGTPGGFRVEGWQLKMTLRWTTWKIPPMFFQKYIPSKWRSFQLAMLVCRSVKFFFCFFERTHRNDELSKHLINHDLIFNLIFLILIYYTCTCFFFGGSIPYPSVKEFVYV